MSCPNAGRFGTLMRNVMIPASLFDTTIVVMSGAAGFSPVESSNVALFAAESVRPGTHINAVGAFTPEMAELPPGVLADAFVVVDDRDAAAAEAGDLIRAGRTPDATLREVLGGPIIPPSGQTTVFKSVGVAAQDVAAGRRALENAARLGLGWCP